MVPPDLVMFSIIHTCVGSPQVASHTLGEGPGFFVIVVPSVELLARVDEIQPLDIF